MKRKYVIVFKKMLDYCRRLDEAYDIFAHRYSSLDCQSVWDTIQQDFSELKTEIDRIKKGMESGKISGFCYIFNKLDRKSKLRKSRQIQANQSISGEEINIISIFPPHRDICGTNNKEVIQ